MNTNTKNTAYTLDATDECGAMVELFGSNLVGALADSCKEISDAFLDGELDCLHFNTRKATAEDLFKFYDEEAIIGFGVPENEVDGFMACLIQTGLGIYRPCEAKAETVYVTTGRFLNETFQLSGKRSFDRYTGFVLIPRDFYNRLEDPKLMSIGMRAFGGSWFNDVINEMRLKPGEAGTFHVFPRR